MQDYTSGKLFDDAVSYAFYPVDLHTKTGVRPKPLKRGIVPSIPLGALIPKGSRNLIVAGRCVSSDRLANSGLRVQASCMGMGQAAAAAATLAVQGNTTPSEVPLAKIHDLLKKARSDHAGKSLISGLKKRRFVSLFNLLLFAVMAGSGVWAFAQPFSIQVIGLHALTGFVFIVVGLHLANNFVP